jgi:hypothetical protein
MAVSLQARTERGRARSIRMSAMMRPGRALITITRSDNATASARSCVIKTTVRRCSFHKLISRSSSCNLVCASSAPKGSSISITGESRQKVRASAQRWRMPCESIFG